MRTKIYNYSIILGLFLVLILSSFVFTTNNLVAFAASGSESESNNTKETANTIAVNSTIRGNLSSRNDVDWYKFTVAQSGYFNVSFEHTLLSSSSTYWDIYIYNDSGVNNIDGTSSDFGVAGNENRTTSNFGIPAGTYYIKIIDDYYSENDYWFTVNFTSSGEWETENNNNMNNADEITLNAPIHGSLSMNGDVDWYKFTVTQSGYFNVSFEHTLLSSSSDYWDIYIYNDSGVNNVDGSSSYYGVDGNANLTTHNFGVSAGTYYIKITQDYKSTNDYSLTVNFTPSGEWETENNNNMNNANEITLNTPIKGALSMNGDVDWYKVVISASREIAITFNHNVLTSSSTYWRYYLYDSSGVTELLSMGRRGDTESATSDFINVSAGTYYIKVVKDSYSGTDYSLCVVERHDHTGIWKTTVEPTCTEKGISSRTCTICGLVETRDIEAHGHSYDDGKVIKEAGVAQKGEIQYTCTICGEQYTKTDGHLLWVIPVGGVIVLIGVINYIRVLRKKKA